MELISNWATSMMETAIRPKNMTSVTGTQGCHGTELTLPERVIRIIGAILTRNGDLYTVLSVAGTKASLKYCSNTVQISLPEGQEGNYLCMWPHLLESQK